MDRSKQTSRCEIPKKRNSNQNWKKQNTNIIIISTITLRLMTLRRFAIEHYSRVLLQTTTTTTTTTIKV